MDGVSKGPIATWTFTNVTANHTVSASFTLMSSGIPRTGDLLFSCVTDTFPASGSTGPWATYIPAGQALAAMGTPSVEIIDGVKWEKNVYTEYDGYTVGFYANPLVCDGVSIVAALRPVYYSVGGEPRGEIVDIFYDRLALAISHGDGRLMVARGNWNDWGPVIPDQQKTILSLVVQPNGSYRADVNGNQVMTGDPYGMGTSSLIISGGVGALNVGHSNPEVVLAIKEQAEKFAHGLDFPSVSRVALSRKLVELAPGRLKGNSKVLMCGPTGADAVEAAIKLTKFHTKKPGIVSFEGGWHGVSGVSLSLTAKRAAKANYLPGVPEVYCAPYPYCFRCPFGMKHPECDLACAHYLEHLIKDPDTGLAAPGGLLIEPIQGEGGIVVPPAGYMKEIRRICDDLLPKGDHRRLSGLAELSFYHGERTRDARYQLAAAVYAYALLFPGPDGEILDASDPRVRLAYDLYNRALTAVVTAESGWGRRELRLPFGSVEIEFDEAEFLWAGHRLVDLVDSANYSVSGLRDRYRRPGIGAPFAARLGPITAQPPAGAEWLVPQVRVPTTLLLRLDGARASGRARRRSESPSLVRSLRWA